MAGGQGDAVDERQQRRRQGEQPPASSSSSELARPAASNSRPRADSRHQLARAGGVAGPAQPAGDVGVEQRTGPRRRGGIDQHEHTAAAFAARFLAQGGGYWPCRPGRTTPMQQQPVGFAHEADRGPCRRSTRTPKPTELAARWLCTSSVSSGSSDTSATQLPVRLMPSCLSISAN